MSSRAKVTLVFKSKSQKSAFISGLLDGWGEGAPIAVTWDHGKSDADGRCEVPATEADVLRIKVLDDD